MAVLMTAQGTQTLGAAILWRGPEAQPVLSRILQDPRSQFDLVPGINSDDYACVLHLHGPGKGDALQCEFNMDLGPQAKACDREAGRSMTPSDATRMVQSFQGPVRESLVCWQPGVSQ